MKTMNLCLIGFGNLGQKFSWLLGQKKNWLKQQFDVDIQVVGIAGRSKGSLLDVNGINLEKALQEVQKSGRFDAGNPATFAGDPVELIKCCGADVMIEMSTLSVEDGEPAATYMRTAFASGMHVITANKGPEAWYYDELAALAKKTGRQFLYETIVMDGTPVFNLVEKTLHGNEISAITGILNSTSNYVLKLLEDGKTYEEAIKAAQEVGIAEADPSMDMDGWDGAAKICSLANIIMKAGITPKDVAVESAAAITAEDVAKAKVEGCCIKYICRAEKSGDGALSVSVKPEKLPLTHSYNTVNGTSAVITFYTDLAGELTMIQTDPGLLQVAYGIYSDLLTLLKGL